MTVKELRKITGLSQKGFSRMYGIPLRTLENWESESPNSVRKCPDYVLELLEFRVRYDYDLLNESDEFGQRQIGEGEERGCRNMERYFIVLETDNPNKEEVEEAMELAVKELDCSQGIYTVSKADDE